MNLTTRMPNLSAEASLYRSAVNYVGSFGFASSEAVFAAILKPVRSAPGFTVCPGSECTGTDGSTCCCPAGERCMPGKTCWCEAPSKPSDDDGDFLPAT